MLNYNIVTIKYFVVVRGGGVYVYIYHRTLLSKQSQLVLREVVSQ